MSAKQVAAKLDYGQIIHTLGLTGTTANSLLAFNRRNEAAKTKVAQLEQQPTSIDFSHYRSVLKNQKVVEELEKAIKSFKPINYDVSKHLKTIEAFETVAVKNAEATQSKVSEELVALGKTLDNIQSARAFEELVVEDILKAAPEVDEKVKEFISKSRWDVPGYSEKFGSTVLM